MWGQNTKNDQNVHSYVTLLYINYSGMTVTFTSDMQTAGVVSQK